MKRTHSPFMLAIAGMLTISTLSQAVLFSVATTANAAETTQNATTANGAAIVEKAIKAATAKIDSGSVDANQATGEFADALVQAGVTINDVDNYVLTTADTATYTKFHANLESAMRGVESQDLTSKEFGQVLQSAIQSSKSEGLSWAGCGGFVAGVVLAVGAVVVGIVALAKTKGTTRIHKTYDDRRSNTTTKYNSDVNYYTNRKANIPNEIASNQSSISYDQTQIAYYTGIAIGTSDPATKNNALAQIQSYNNDITSRNATIAQLNLELTHYNDPAYLTGILADLKVKYDADMTSLNTEEADKVKNVPANKKLAGTLGIVAGVSAAVGTVLIIGGQGECN